jgi:hypothetical protein
MPKRELKVARLALVALIGALILEIVITFAVGLREAFTTRQIPAHLAAVLVGALAGWIFELIREITSTAAETLEAAQQMQTSFEALTTRITYQEKALDMLLACPRHNDALSKLIKASISDNYKRIPLVGAGDYLDFLRRAVVHSDGYEGIQRKPLSWFMKSNGGEYLSDLSKRNMQYKIRLIIIDESDKEQWGIDLHDEKCKDYFWKHTKTVTTYWIYAKDFLNELPWLHSVPDDLALYDKQLLISYNESTQVLSFDVVNSDAEIIRIFQAVDRLARHNIPVLHRLSRTTELT